MEISCPSCGKSQKIENRRCNECFRDIVKESDGVIHPADRRFGFMQEDKEDMSQGVFRCV